MPFVEALAECGCWFRLPDERELARCGAPAGPSLAGGARGEGVRRRGSCRTAGAHAVRPGGWCALNIASIGAFLDSFAGALRFAGAGAIGGASWLPPPVSTEWTEAVPPLTPTSSSRRSEGP